MYPANDRISRRQFVAMSFACMLSPLIRRVPGRTVDIAGSGAWLSILLSAAPLGLLFALVISQMQGGSGKKGLGEIMINSLGNFMGKAVLTLYAMWFIFYAAFTLRSDADRLITTVYPNSAPAVFIISMLIACLPAALGPLKAVARSSMLFRPVLLGVLLLVFMFALPDVDLKGIWQISPRQELPILEAALDTVNPLCTCVYLAFIADQTEPGLKFPQFAAWFAVIIAIAELMCITTVGMLGVELTAKIHNPFFALVRDITIFGSIEHVEAVLVTIWVFSDFVLISALLYMAAKNLRLLFCFVPSEEKPRLFDMSHGRFLTPVCFAVAMAAALLIAPESTDLQKYTNFIIPAVNLSMAFVILPLVFLIGRLRKKT